MHRLAPLSIAWNFRVRNYAGNSRFKLVVLLRYELEINLKLLRKGGRLGARDSTCATFTLSGVRFVKRESVERV